MKYKKNGDLMNEVIKNGKLDPKLVLRMIREITECLVYLS